MSPSPGVGRSRRPRRFGLPVMLAVVALATAGSLVVGVHTSIASGLATATSSPATSGSPAASAGTTTSAPPMPPALSPPVLNAEDSDAVSEADGGVAEGVTVFDEQVPAVSRLVPDLRAALQRAATDAADDGVTFAVNSGWRSAAYQRLLLREAIEEYGSAAEAARWVATPATSPHVRGEAMDIGGSGADVWLAARGARYGLCQTYANEPWHYELRAAATSGGCPAMYPDPTYDPRMHG